MDWKLKLVSVAVVCVFVGTAAATLNTPDAKYRKLKPDGTGNCIFSTAGLPYQQEDTYNVATAITAPDEVFEARCYYPQLVREFMGIGASFNSIRDEYGRYNVHTVVADANDTIQWEYVGQLRMSDSSAEWDQQRFPMSVNSGHCRGMDDSDLGTNGCMDPEKRIRAIAKAEGASLPYTGKVCLFVFMNWADQYEERWDGARLIEDPVNIQATNMATGCVDYTVQ